MPSYVAEVTLILPDLDPGEPTANQVIAALTNPADSGVVIAVTSLTQTVVTKGNPPGLIVERYPVVIETVVKNPPADDAPDVWALDDGADAAKGVVTTIASHDITQPDPELRTFEMSLAALVQMPAIPMTVSPGHTGVIKTRQGGDGISISLAIQWVETPVTPP